MSDSLNENQILLYEFFLIGANVTSGGLVVKTHTI